jgi:peptidyl-tRNA hydrolase, PTH1 family
MIWICRSEKRGLKPPGGSGGHHGLDSLLSHLNGNQFPRLRIGVGKPPSAIEGPDHVLSGFNPDDKIKIEKAIERSSKMELKPIF